MPPHFPHKSTRSFERKKNESKETKLRPRKTHHIGSRRGVKEKGKVRHVLILFGEGGYKT